MVTLQTWCLQPMEIVLPQVLIGLFGSQDMVDDHDDAMRYGPDRFVLPSSSSNAMVLGMQVRSARTGHAHSDLSQDSSKPDITFGGSSIEPFAPTLSVPRTDTGPRGQMLSGRETGHIGANLGHNNRCCNRINARNRLQQGDGESQKGPDSTPPPDRPWQSPDRESRCAIRSAQ